MLGQPPSDFHPAQQPGDRDELFTSLRCFGEERGALASWEAETKALSGGRHTITVGHADGVEIAGDEGELLSAVTNLLSNAVRYTPEGGATGCACRRRA